jgi:hypothetical protein
MEEDEVDLTSLMLKVCLLLVGSLVRWKSLTYPKLPESGEAPHSASEALTRHTKTTNFLNIITSL